MLEGHTQLHVARVHHGYLRKPALACQDAHLPGCTVLALTRLCSLTYSMLSLSMHHTSVTFPMCTMYQCNAKRRCTICDLSHCRSVDPNGRQT